MSTIYSVLKKLKQVEQSYPGYELKEAIEELRKLQKTSVVFTPSDPESLREYQLEVARNQLLIFKANLPPGVHAPHHSAMYTDVVRYWKDVRGISLKEAASAIANLYSTLN